ncbi:F0F1 ATP synthase subunit epsilon [Kibdelosporangium persicum]|uniref:ATP synthase epsilon chain n=1 Tax=Kibdelosporangium persicum TaxID=2698649 RepID=A0ABX2FF49_9PSEU|nr:F0F1 ATP synthase subunit epsilon [Kibdelosporangium persicum]NRN69922.1 F-type H+-transporting ATPase subunit epsilon [Kibdelosporangium persicum]
MAEISVELVAVERRLWSGKATMVIAQTIEGELGVLPGHEPLLGQLVEGGVVKIRTVDGDTVIAAVQGGFLSVTGDGVSILAENAELADEIDIDQARAEVAAAQDADERARAEARVRAAGQTV